MKSEQATGLMGYHSLFWQSHLALIAVLILWWLPLTHSLCVNIDDIAFRILNGSLFNHPFWQLFWGILNHRNETKFNLLMAVFFNLWGIMATSNHKMRSIRTKQILYFWVFFQIGFMLQEYLFFTLLEIKRDSPSLILEPVAKLSIILDNPKIKDASYHSFPSGHAFSLIYWAAFTWLCVPKKIAKLGIAIAILLSFARLFSGAHWFSDVLFSSLLALVWLSWAINTPIYKNIVKQKYLLPNI